MVWFSLSKRRARIHIMFFSLDSLFSWDVSISTFCICEGPCLLPTLYGGSASCCTLILLCFDLTTVGNDLCKWGPKIVCYLAIPFTLWDVRLPLIVSSDIPMLSNAKIVKIPGLMLVGKNTLAYREQKASVITRRYQPLPILNMKFRDPDDWELLLGPHSLSMILLQMEPEYVLAVSHCHW